MVCVHSAKIAISEVSDRSSKVTQNRKSLSLVLSKIDLGNLNVEQNNFLVLRCFVYGDIHYRLSYLLTMEPYNKRVLIWLVGFFAHPERRYVHHVYSGDIGQEA